MALPKLFPVVIAVGISLPLSAWAVGSESSTSVADVPVASVVDQLNILSAEGDYSAMLALLDAYPGDHDAALLNYRGYALRKTGKPEEAIHAYRRALALDPDYHEARAYLGQGLLDLGDVEAARAELLEIRARGGRGSLAYVTLKNALLDKTGY